MKTTETTVRFDHPFHIGEYEDELPAGVYTVEEDEDEVLDVSFEAFRRVRTILQVPRGLLNSGEARSMTISPADLLAALSTDRATSEAAAETPAAELAFGPPTISQDLTGAEARDIEKYGITCTPKTTYQVDGYRYGSLQDAVAQAKRSANDA